mgnify:CR=1 FL=1
MTTQPHTSLTACEALISELRAIGLKGRTTRFANQWTAYVRISSSGRWMQATEHTHPGGTVTRQFTIDPGPMFAEALAIAEAHGFEVAKPWGVAGATS